MASKMEVEAVYCKEGVVTYKEGGSVATVHSLRKADGFKLEYDPDFDAVFAQHKSSQKICIIPDGNIKNMEMATKEPVKK